MDDGPGEASIHLFSHSRTPSHLLIFISTLLPPPAYFALMGSTPLDQSLSLFFVSSLIMSCTPVNLRVRIAPDKSGNRTPTAWRVLVQLVEIVLIAAILGQQAQNQIVF